MRPEYDCTSVPRYERYTRVWYQQQPSPELNNSPIIFPRTAAVVSFVSWHQLQPGVSITQSKQLWNCGILIHQNMENWNRRLPSTSMSRILSFLMRSSMGCDQVNQGSQEEAGSCHGPCTQAGNTRATLLSFLWLRPSSLHHKLEESKLHHKQSLWPPGLNCPFHKSQLILSLD